MAELVGRSGGGFTVPDGLALVAGAAVALAHLRGALRVGAAGPGWVMVWGTFVWVGLTSAGPFLFAARRHGRGLPGPPRVGERLWAVLGLPWVVTAVLRGPAGGRLDGAFAAALSLGLGVAVTVAMAGVWTTWVVVTPERASATFSPPWTNRVGLVLAIAWPVQCGLGMVVIG
ncbi:MAG: hypothetical protein LC745_00930 [Planctomycetia bacterium]|nr:hypothetical protein [Planctomycetia bacterium]